MSAGAPPSPPLDLIIGRRGPRVFDALVVAALVGYVALFLAVRKATNICFFTLVLLSLAYLATQREAFAAAAHTRHAGTLIAALASVFLAAVAAKVARGEFDHTDLDGPARYLLAALVMIFLAAKRVCFVRAFALALPLAAPLALVAALFNPELMPRWGGRYATSFVDPNTLGSYAVVLTFMSLLTLDASSHDARWRRGLGSAAVAAGLLLAILAGSRGGWLAIAPLVALWIYFRSSFGARHLIGQGLAIAAAAAIVTLLSPDISARAIGAADEIRAWFDGSNPETAAGQRLSIWMLCLQLFAAHPFTGYGGAGVAAQLALPESASLASPTIAYTLIHGGPHNDLLAMSLGYGVFGTFAYFAVLFVPMLFFWRQRAASTGNARLACELGVCLTTGVFACGIANEMLSLKYLASFYGLTVAGLAAQVLSQELPAATLSTATNPESARS